MNSCTRILLIGAFLHLSKFLNFVKRFPRYLQLTERGPLIYCEKSASWMSRGLKERSWMKPRDSIWPLYDQTWAPRCGFISGIKLNWTPMVCFFLESMITDNENDDQNLLLISVYNLQWMFATQIYTTNVVYELYRVVFFYCPP